ncbi:TRAP transporter small permease [Oceanisphaera psychrotolerans]|uniref:TRAP transporter small permease protein n=1 Tax=Oceanisphaera psychrotolerans TaxID=1414654 RepID=A0A1J4QFX5_9GAMM|nr:TRAP transporter small permease [Oceanisphaera psychrotolerans]OIN08933.1 C4-dicarboxylate ABC transporter permease [Oceanisphaera psychrotolerans]
MKAMIRWLDRNLEAMLGGTLLAGIVFLITTQVVMRYVFGNALSWSEELTLWSFIWFIWLGISYAFKERKHVKVTFFPDLLPKKFGNGLEVVIDVMIVIFLLMMTYQSYKLISLPYVLTQQSVVLNMPIPVLYASAPIGSLLSVFRIVQHHVKKFSGHPTPVEA